MRVLLDKGGRGGGGSGSEGGILEGKGLRGVQGAALWFLCHVQLDASSDKKSRASGNLLARSGVRITPLSGHHEC